DGRRLLAGNYERAIACFDLADGQELHRLAGNFGRPNRLIVSPDGRWLVVTTTTIRTPGEQAVHLWDLITFREVRRIAPRRGPCVAVVFSPDGRHLTAACRGIGRTSEGQGEIQTWDVVMGREVRTLGAGPMTTALGYSPDGRMLATGGGDSTIHLWEMSTGG